MGHFENTKFQVKHVVSIFLATFRVIWATFLVSHLVTLFRSDRILVVGAHWDTVPNSPGYNDNGSGMAALLELARALKHAECKNTYTYMLVALDMEETGTQGATAFVQGPIL